MNTDQKQVPATIHIALDIDDVLHSTDSISKHHWKSYVDNGTWSAQEFHEAVRESYVQDIRISLENEFDEQPGFLLSHMPFLEAVLLRHPGVRLVIASDWRKSFANLDKLCSLFSPVVAARVVGKLSVDPGPDPLAPDAPTRRGHLMVKWMTENVAPDTPWLAVDDDLSHWGDHKDHLIRTQKLCGLDMQTTLELDRRITEC
jgi:hypothetical protein